MLRYGFECKKKKKETHLLCKKQQKDEAYIRELDMHLKVKQHYILLSFLNCLLGINVTAVNLKRFTMIHVRV